jgi:uncharacterized protein with FMN-binding domain
MDQNANNSKNQLILGLIAIVILAALVGGTIYMKGTDEASVATSSANTTATSEETMANESASNTTESAGSYKDGTYNATGTYNSPGGTESIKVSVTLTGNAISDVTVTPQAASGESAQYQEEFVSGYKSQVVGKAIDEVMLSKVSGSSLTSRGFNDAIDDIKSQAKS